MARGSDRMSNFLSNPPTYLRAVTYIAETSSHMTLNNKLPKQYQKETPKTTIIPDKNPSSWILGQWIMNIIERSYYNFFGMWSANNGTKQAVEVQYDTSNNFKNLLEFIVNSMRVSNIKPLPVLFCQILVNII